MHPLDFSWFGEELEKLAKDSGYSSLEAYKQYLDGKQRGSKMSNSRGYRNGDENGHPKKFSEKQSSPVVNYKKVVTLDFDELKDPQRKNLQIITKNDEADIRLDLYLFGKGGDINA